MTQTRRSPPRGPAGDSDDPTLRDIDIDAGGVAVDEREEPAPTLAERFTDWRRHYFPLPDEVVDEYLADDEYVIHSDHPSFRAFLIQNVTQVALATVMLPVVFAFVRMDLEWWWILLMVLGLDLVLLVLAIKRLGDRYTSYVITNLRLIRCSGIVSRRLASIPWTRMTGLGYRQKPIGRLMGFATIHIESANEESGLREFSDINDPATFHQLILDMTMSKAGPKPEKPTKGVRRTLRQRRREAREAARRQAETAKAEAVEAAGGGNGNGKGNGNGDGDAKAGTATPSGPDTPGSGGDTAAEAKASTGAGAEAAPVSVKDPTPPSGTPVVRINPPPGTTVTDRSGRRTGPGVPPADDAPPPPSSPSSSPSPDPASGRPRSRRPGNRPGTPGPGRGRAPAADPVEPIDRSDAPADPGDRPGPAGAATGPGAGRGPGSGPGSGPGTDTPGRGAGRPAGGRRPRGADRATSGDRPRPSGRGDGPAVDPSVADLGGTPGTTPPPPPPEASAPPRPTTGPGAGPGAGTGPVTPPRQRLAGPRQQAADAGVSGLGDGPGSRRTRPPGNRPGNWARPGGQRPDSGRPGSPGTASPQPASAAAPSEPLFDRLRREAERLRASLRRSGTEIDPETGERVTARDALGQVRRGGGSGSGRGTPRRRPRFPSFGRSQPKTPSNRQLPATSTPPTPPRGNRPTRIDDE